MPTTALLGNEESYPTNVVPGGDEDEVDAELFVVDFWKALVDTFFHDTALSQRFVSLVDDFSANDNPPIACYQNVGNHNQETTEDNSAMERVQIDIFMKTDTEVIDALREVADAFRNKKLGYFDENDSWVAIFPAHDQTTQVGRPIHRKEEDEDLGTVWHGWIVFDFYLTEDSVGSDE